MAEAAVKVAAAAEAVEPAGLAAPAGAGVAGWATVKETAAVGWAVAAGRGAGEEEVAEAPVAAVGVGEEMERELPLLGLVAPGARGLVAKEAPAKASEVETQPAGWR